MLLESIMSTHTTDVTWRQITVSTHMIDATSRWIIVSFNMTVVA